MKVAFFSAKPYDIESFRAANGAFGHDISFFEPRLTIDTAPLGEGHDAVCAFVNDELHRDVLGTLVRGGVRAIALRSAGFNQVDLQAAAALDLPVARVPAYSPHAVAEHAVGLILALNRRIHRAYNRVRENNFALQGLLGFDLHGRTVGIVGTGMIGTVFARIMAGFGCDLLAHDPYPSPLVEDLGARYLPLDELFARSHIVSLHCPLTPETRHLVDLDAISRMREGVMLVNTSRGALIDTLAVIEGLKAERIGSLAIDVYEEEADLFFEDLSDRVVQDDIFARLLTFPNVIVTAHQAFFTEEALAQIATTTLANLTAIESGQGEAHLVRAPAPRS